VISAVLDHAIVVGRSSSGDRRRAIVDGRPMHVRHRQRDERAVLRSWNRHRR
jgi:hypothetical protein